MANVVKIYEVRTIGYEQVMNELKNIDAQFVKIAESKKNLNKIKSSDDDVKKSRNVSEALKEEKARTEALRLERQKLINEGKALQNAKQNQINQSRQAAAANIAEAGSLTDLIAKQKLLKAAISGSAGPNVNFGGQSISKELAVTQLGALNQQIGTLKGNLLGTQDIGQRMTTALSNGFQRIRGSLGQMILMYTGWFAAFREASQLIAENIKLSDSFADLQIRIKGTAKDTQDLFNELKKLNTRTSLKDLVDIANVVAKKGVPREEIAGLTAEFDKLNVVLGKEIGEPSLATANIIKLITIFNDDKHVTAERVREIGTELFKLTTSGVATGEFLVNFAERVGAVRGITGLTLPNILGMGAALQQLGQRTEVAGTAAVQLTTKVFTDVPRFANAAGKSIEEFRKTLDKNPFEALIQVAEGLKNLPDDLIKNKFEDVVAAFGEVGVTGVRIKAVLGDIATNGSFVRDRMKEAATTTQDYANMTTAVELKQHTFAATLERIRKEFELIATNKAVQVTLAAVGAVILFLVGNIGTLITVLAVYGTLWTIANAEMLIAKGTIIATNAAMVIQRGIFAITNIFIQAYTVSMGYLTGATTAATASTRLLSIAMRLIPIGLLIAALALLAAGCNRVAQAVTGGTEALKAQTKAQLIHQEVVDKANAAVADQISKMESLVTIVTSSKTSYDTSRAALDELIKSNARFSSALKGNAIDLNEVRRVLGEVRKEILLTAQAQASESLTGEAFKGLLNVKSLRQRFERASVTTGRVNAADLPPELLKIMEENLKDLPRNTLITDAFFTTKGFEVTKNNIDQFKAFFKNLEDGAFENYKAYQTESTQLSAQLADLNKKSEEETKRVTSQSVAERIAFAKDHAVSGDELEALIKEISKQIDTLKEGDPKLAELIRLRDQFDKRLKELRGKTKEPGGSSFRGARLTGEDKDALAEIDAQNRLELALEEQRFSALKADHRASFDEEIQYVENVKNINLKYINQKIQYLESVKNLNVKEREQLATFKKALYDEELKAQDAIQAIHDRDFQLRRQNLKATLDNQIAAIELQQKAVETDASIGPIEKAQAKLDSDRRILSLQEQFNKQIDILEKQLNQRSKENTLEGAQTREKIIADSIAIYQAMFKDAAEAVDSLEAQERTKAADRVIKVLSGNKSAQAQAREIAAIESNLKDQLLYLEGARLKIELDLYQRGLDSKLKSEREYQVALARYKEIEAQIVRTNTEKNLSTYEKFSRALKNFGDNFIQNVLGIKKYTKDAAGEAEKYADALAVAEQKSKEAIQEAIQGYFRRQTEQVDRDKDAAQKRLDIEQEQVRARAQSQAEIESIDKQYAAKKAALDKKAGEEKKRLALKELAIDFAVAIIKSIAQFGLPLALIPIAAETVLYFVQRSNIQQQTFKYGGKPKPGPIDGPSHAHGGVKYNFEAEGEEIFIINKNSAKDNKKYTVSGTPAQIASKINEIGGGIQFQPGASYRRYAQGGFLGTAYPAPIFKATGSTDIDMETIVAEIRNLANEQSKRIDRIEVVQKTSTVTDAQKKLVRQSQIGILP